MEDATFVQRLREAIRQQVDEIAGRIPGFSAPLLCPSVLPGIELEPLGEVAGLPAFAAPQDEPWVYDGRIVLRVRPSS